MVWMTTELSPPEKCGCETEYFKKSSILLFGILQRFIRFSTRTTSFALTVSQWCLSKKEISKLN
jgi:hypothetical protein